MTKPKLLASAGSLEDLEGLIARFYGGERKRLQYHGEGFWTVHHDRDNSPALRGVRVVSKRGRYRFEMLGEDNSPA